MGNQSKLISVILFTAIFVLADNVDAHYACLDINRLTKCSEYTYSVTCMNSIYGSDKPVLNAIADNVGSPSDTNSRTCNVIDYSKGCFPSYFNGTSIVTVSFEHVKNTDGCHPLATFAGDSNKLESVIMNLRYRQSDNDKFAHIDSLARSFRFADLDLHRMQLTNLCIKPVPEPTAVSLVCLVLADWSSFTNVNKHIIKF
ncbi:MAG: hypothetical protein A2173_06680 [Planctomycetes bacterium RBG_13_44_8b]|nr:MAG: hypothetical protein A2173_06680 [Planctomycetes bacterium RBG_13_44_8b]